MNIKTTAVSLAVVGVMTTGGVIATDNSINPYQTIGTTLQEEHVSGIPEGGKDRVIIDTIQPKVIFSRWNNEVNMGVRYMGIHAPGARKFLSKEVDWKQGNETMQAIPLEEGGYEINIVLDGKPVSNVFNFSIDGAENLDFFYQPPLTSEEINAGTNRPDDVVGSYAVYYKDHANHIEGQTNYATGKAFHIFRPKVIDANGATIWAALTYSHGILSINVPQNFLDNAAYPVTIDPTFGYLTIGASDATCGGVIDLAIVTAIESGTLTKISVAIKSSNGNPFDSNAALYDNASPRNLQTNGQMTAVTGTTQTTYSFIDYNAPVPAIITPTTYRLAGWGSVPSGGACQIANDTVVPVTGSQKFGVGYTGTFPTTISGDLNASSILSMYATYTASAKPSDSTIFFQ